MKHRTCIVIMTLIAFVISPILAQEKTYPHTEDSRRQPGVPQGTVTKYQWESKIYDPAGKYREYSVYVPAQYDPDKPAALMVFQDGHAYLWEEGDFRVPVVFDNLIAKQEMPVTIGVFVNPGHTSTDFPANQFHNVNRSWEYDEMSERYAEFLIDELIPEIRKKYTISDDPKMHAICGLSSGGICAFTAAWQRPEYFHKVLSHYGSFTDIRGGNAYPSMIRKDAKRDIRVYLQDGENDLDNRFGNWWIANQDMAAALKFRGYDYVFVTGTGGHDSKQGGAGLPDALRWLWRE